MSVLDALRQADSIDQIVSPSPLDLFASLQIFIGTALLALQVSKQDSAGMREQLLKGVSHLKPLQMPWKLEEHVSEFNLFDEKQPFLTRPFSLRADSKDNSQPPQLIYRDGRRYQHVAHFHHSDDKTMHDSAFECATL